MKDNFETLITRLTPTIRRISHRLNGHFTFFNDDDLYQEAVIHLWIKSGKGILDDKTDSYILQGCYFHLKNYIRTSMDKVKIQSIESPIDEDGTMLEEVLALNESSCEEQVEDKILYDEAYKNDLNDREIAIIKMSTDGLTVREMGEKLGISHVAVIKLRKKIRAKCEKLRCEIKRSYQN
ncbi:MAG: sigma-70 family RNA polymerase sigma factor [Candidatus Omnitrophota bacterium]|nr:sigma-70 family RNA polymerase sigma factor [Candidatus Omnitrophota bacterium]